MPLKLKQAGRGGSVVIGLMSGTSADGIDAVVARISQQKSGKLKAKVVAHEHRKFPKGVGERVLKACLHGHVAEICELNFLLGEIFAASALGAMRKAGLKAVEILAIGSHGQTLHHLPWAAYPSTLQIGEPSVIAERTGVTVVADFRVRDMAVGGQGAPLVPFTDWALLTDKRKPRIVQNIGGIGNLTFLPASARLEEVTAFDTGPGNMVMDAIVKKLSGGKKTYDQNGSWAAHGKVSEKLLQKLMEHEYLERRPPKTTGREEFGEPFVNRVLTLARKEKLKAEDIVATVTAFTAESIARAYKRFVFPKLRKGGLDGLEIILGGGGAKNGTLRKMLETRVGVGRILTHEDLGIDNSAKEALAFAILAYETLQGKPSNVPGATGARKPVVLGKIIPA